MHEICRICTSCAAFLPDPEPEARMLVTDYVSEGASAPFILVLDDARDKVEASNAMMTLFKGVLPDGIDFSYSRTIRCGTKGVVKGLVDAASRCSVWTNLIANERSILISTVRGLEQLRVLDEIGVGDMRRHERFGLVLCIKPIYQWDASDLKAYTTKVKFLLKKVEVKDGL